MTDSVEFSRPLALDRLGGGVLVQEVTATAEECTALARRLGIPAVLSLGCRFRLRRAGAGRIEADADLRARLVRTCVITLDDFTTDIVEAFRVVFVPAGTESDDPDPESDDDIPYAGTALDLGEAAAEQLALTLDPYPHKPGAELPAKAGEGTESPFAALARRRRG